MQNERLIELLQKHIWDRGLTLEGEMEKAVLEFGLECLKGVRIEGKEEDVKEFKKYLPRFASTHNVTIIEN